MHVARDTSSYQPVRLTPEKGPCPRCGRELKRGYNGIRFVAGLEERLEIAYEVWRCGRQTCPDVFPPFLRHRVLPGYEYGLDVIAFIGHRRLRDNLTFREIRERLRGDHHVEISEREVEYLFTQYIALVSTPIEKDPARLDKLRRQGRIVVSLDAAKPEADRDSLWIFRDVISGEILAGFSCLSIDAEGLARVLRQIKALDIPITGVVSDGQNIIINAAAKALSGVPHQLCQFHFLKDIANTARRTARDGAFLIPALEEARTHLPTAEDLAAVSPAVREGNLKRILQTRERFARARKIRRHLPLLLERLRTTCSHLREAPRASRRNLRP